MESIGADAAFMAAAASKAFITLMEPHRLMYLMAGCMMGLVLGIVPGIGGLAGTAMLLPFSRFLLSNVRAARTSAAR